MTSLSDLELQAKVIPHLAGKFEIGEPILFTGAGFSLGAGSRNGYPIPGVGDLSKLLWEVAFPDDAYDETSELQDIFEAAMSTAKTKVISLLEERFRVRPDTIKEYQLKLLNLPWKAIYTLNIDDLIEQALQSLGYSVEPVSALNGTSDLLAPSNKLKIVHLNGVLDDAPDAITFSRNQYALRSHDPFFSSLATELRFRPVVFVGTSLEEKLLWQYMALRGNARPGRSERELRPQSYLVIPSLPLPKARNLANYNIAWYSGKTENFCRSVVDKLDRSAEIGRAHLRNRRSNASRPKLKLVGDISHEKDKVSDYLFGAEPTWSDALSSRIAQRPSIEKIDVSIRQCASTHQKPNLVLVTGTAGSGKSSSMMMSALHWQAEGLPTAWIDRDSLYDSRRLEDELLKLEGVRVVYIEDSDLLKNGLIILADTLARVRPDVTLVAESRSAKVDFILNDREPNELGAIETAVPPLADEDIDSLLEVLDRENRLGELKGKSRDEQAEIFRKECGRQLLVAMYRATQGRDFKEKAQDEFVQLSPGQRAIYAIVAVAHANRFYVERTEIAIAFGADHQS